MTPAKPCKHCGSDKHWPFQCFIRPGQPKRCLDCGSDLHRTSRCSYRRLLAMKRKTGKGALRWASTRRAWFSANKGISFHCYICGVFMLKSETTLDHVKPRGSHAHLRYELTNLEPCCGPCQTSKGSKSLKNYIAERDRLGLPVSDYARQRAEGM